MKYKINDKTKYIMEAVMRLSDLIMERRFG